MPYTNAEKRREYYKEYKRKKRLEKGIIPGSRGKFPRKPVPPEILLERQKARREYEFQWRKENPWSSRDIVARLLGNAKKRAKENHLEFNITKEDIVIPEYCPYLGIKLTSSMPRGTSRRDVASLDRIDPTKGYIKGNIEVISHLANTMKSDATPELLLKFADAINQKLRLPGL